nr:ATP-binding protein [Paracoccus ravus]
MVRASEDLIWRVFEPFFRVDQARHKSVPVAGLGLAVACEIIERHKGSITIRNREPQGLEQICRLPLSRPSDRRL